MKTIKALAMATVLALGTSGFAQAQVNKLERQPTEKTSVKVLGSDEIGTVLDTMGYEYTITDSEDKATRWYNVKINRKELGGMFEVSLALSPNKKKVWSHVHVADMKPEMLQNAEALAKLLEQNAAIGPNHFRLDPKTKGLYVSRCTDNRNLTPALIREHIENLVDSCVTTKDAWTQLSTLKTTSK